MNNIIDILKQKKVFIFNLDGTIADLEMLNFNSASILIKKHFGLKLTWEEYIKHFTDKKIYSAFKAYIKTKNLKYCNTDILIKEFDITKANFLKENFANSVMLKTGVIHLLDTLKKQKKKIILTTSTNKSFTEYIINNLNLNSYFNYIITAEDIIENKTETNIYFLALQKAKCKLEDAVVFDNSLDGIKSAKSAKIVCIGIKNKVINRNITPKYDYLIENFNHLLKTNLHPKNYQYIQKQIKHIQIYFDIYSLNKIYQKYEIFKFTHLFNPQKPLLILMAGCHGEEIAPILTIFEKYEQILKTAQLYNVNLIIYPLVNPWGFDNQNRFNPKNLSCNRGWITVDKTPITQEVKIIKKDIIKYKPNMFVSLHEDDDIINRFYMYTFKLSQNEPKFINVAQKYFPIMEDQKHYGNCAKNGVITDSFHGTAEDFIYKRGCKFSYCTETPSSESLTKRINCNLALIKTAIKITSQIKKTLHYK